VYFLAPKAENDDLVPEDTPLDIVYEDEHILAVNKPADMIVHPAGRVKNGTLANALKFYLQNDPQTIEGFARPGLVHRLDRDTTGILLIAKNEAAMNGLGRAIKNREVKKLYIALLYGKLSPEQGEIHSPIGRDPNNRKKMKAGIGRPSYTMYNVIGNMTGPTMTLTKVRIITGRTHQIRVHFASIGHPVIGDKTYNPEVANDPVSRQMLHAARIEFTHPITHVTMSIDAPLPNDFRDILAPHSLIPNATWYDLSDFD
jgi:23S rRNA pseudouridine1911/1915/1917 synthase